MLGEVSDSVTSRLELYHFIYVLAPIIFLLIYNFVLKSVYGKDL